MGDDQDQDAGEVILDGVDRFYQALTAASLPPRIQLKSGHQSSS
ncbi:MAG: hypothetical protein M5U34_48265 [Chloroflexi bacterium]|nr:hypothetical protein [Chloroflexota bacterium]